VFEGEMKWENRPRGPEKKKGVPPHKKKERGEKTTEGSARKRPQRCVKTKILRRRAVTKKGKKKNRHRATGNTDFMPKKGKVGGTNCGKGKGAQAARKLPRGEKKRMEIRETELIVEKSAKMESGQ